MTTERERAAAIVRINRMAKEVATGAPTRTGDERDPESSIYDDGRINLRYSPKDDSITVVVNGRLGPTPVYMVSGAKPEKPHVFLQGSWDRVLEALHRKLVKAQEER